MPVSPGKVFLRNIQNKLWSGRARRIARIIDADAQKRAQDNSQPAPTTKTTPGSTG